MVIVERVDRAVPAASREVGGGELVGVRPPDERGGLVAVSGGGIGQPAVEVGLPERGQGEVVGVEPVEECLGRASVGADAQDLLSGCGAAVVSAAQTSEQVPGQVAVQQSTADRILSCIKEISERAFKTDEFLVAFGERTDADQREA